MDKRLYIAFFLVLIRFVRQRQHQLCSAAAPPPPPPPGTPGGGGHNGGGVGSGITFFGGFSTQMPTGEVIVEPIQQE